MITRELFAFLKDDAELSALLGATAAQPRIFPNIIKSGEEPPFLCYRSVSAARNDEPLREETVAFDITAEDYATIERAAVRLAELFDSLRLEAEGWTVLHARPAACADSADELGRHVKTVAFTFKFLKKGAL